MALASALAKLAAHWPPVTVSLVGAGPGDPGLITAKGLARLLAAEVVLYDYLAAPELLALLPEGTETVCVGKRAGAHSVPQEQINQLLLAYAQAGKRVVRLKGGDPFIFGRGAEELQTLTDAGIDFEVVPGVTAAAGCSAYAGIPLTHRDAAQTVVFITGQSRYGGKEPDWAALARPHQTLVIYMGLLTSEQIQQQLVSNGRDPATPVALIERGTTTAQRVRLTHLGQLAASVRHEQIASPGLIVIGEVVALAPQLGWFAP